MGKRGPKPRPEPLKILAGERADRINPAAPAPIPGAPECPEHLDEVARGEWDRMIALLDRMGVISRTDGAALALYCSIYSRWLRAKDEIRVDMLTTSDTGYLRANPAVAIAAKCEDQMARLLAEFGCTPSSRGRLNVAKPEVKRDKLGEFLARRKNG